MENSDKDRSFESFTDDNIGGSNVGKESFRPSNLMRINQRDDLA
jgi:hypothetical protein